VQARRDYGISDHRMTLSVLRHRVLVKKFRDDIRELADAILEAGLKILFTRSIIGPVDDQSFADDMIPGHGPPDPAVLAVVPVVTHGEIVVRGHVERSVVLVDAARLDVLGVFSSSGLPLMLMVRPVISTRSPGKPISRLT